MSAPGSRPIGEETGTRSMMALQHVEGIETWETFTSDLNTAMQKVVPVNNPYYDAVIMGLRFKKDDLNVAEATKNLLAAFESSFKFKTVDHVIKTVDDDGNEMTDKEIMEELAFVVRELKSKFRSKPKERNSLMIFYYSGHADFVGDVYKLAGYLEGPEEKRVLAGPMVVWSELSSAINTENDEDVLVIADTCYAGSMAIKQSPEMFGAAAREAKASDDLLHCFSARLTELILECKGRGITVVTLHKILTDRLEVQDNVKTATYYSPHISKPSITLAPRASREYTELKEVVNLLPPGKKSIINVKCVVGETVRVPSATEWLKYLSTNMPKDLQDIEITHGYEASSTHYFIRMPLELYYYLPARAAYQFVGRVKEGARLAPEPARTAVSAAQLQENIRPSHHHSKSYDPSSSSGC